MSFNHSVNYPQGVAPRVKAHTSLTFGERLRIAYEKEGLSQGQAADALGVDQTQLSRWVTSDREPRLKAIQKAVQAFGLNGHWLLTGEGDPEDLPSTAEQLYYEIRDIVMGGPYDASATGKALAARVAAARARQTRDLQDDGDHGDSAG